MFCIKTRVTRIAGINSSESLRPYANFPLYRKSRRARCRRQNALLKLLTRLPMVDNARANVLLSLLFFSFFFLYLAIYVNYGRPVAGRGRDCRQMQNALQALAKLWQTSAPRRVWLPMRLLFPLADLKYSRLAYDKPKLNNLISIKRNTEF